EALVVGLGQLDDEIVRHQRAALGHDGGPVVHLTLDGAGHLDRLQLGPEGAREGTLHHAFKTTLEALQNSQRATSLHVPCPRSYPGRGSARGRANLLVARGGWRNGRRARFRSVCPKGREGSNPSSPTQHASPSLCTHGTRANQSMRRSACHCAPEAIVSHHWPPARDHQPLATGAPSWPGAATRA